MPEAKGKLKTETLITLNGLDELRLLIPVEFIRGRLGQLPGCAIAAKLLLMSWSNGPDIHHV